MTIHVVDEQLVGNLRGEEPESTGPGAKELRVSHSVRLPGADRRGPSFRDTRVTQRHPGIRVVIVTVHDDPDLAERGYAAGALAYVTKDSAAQDLVAAVRAALRGERYVSASTPRIPEPPRRGGA